MGVPEISETAKSDPDRESVTEKSCPCEPCTSTTIDPEPITLSPFLTLNPLFIILSFFHFPKGT